MLRVLRTVLVVLSAVALSGCIGYEEHVTFKPDGSGSYELKFGFDMTLLKSVGQMGGQPDPPAIDTEPLVERFGEDVEMETLSEEIDGRTYEGFRVKIGFISPDVFEELASAVAQGAAARTAASAGRVASELKLSVSGFSYTLTGVIPPLFDRTEYDNSFARMVFSTSRRVFRLTLPGHVTAANADKRDGQTYTWTLDPLANYDRSVSVTWDAAGNAAQNAEPAAPPRPVATPRARM